MTTAKKPAKSTFLTADEQLLMEQLLAEEEGLELTPRETIPRRLEGEEASLSFAQQRLWFLQQLEPASPAYNVPFAVELRGRLEIGALDRALAEIVRRHEVLRTTFPTVSGLPAQRVHRSLPGVLLSRIDLRSLADPRRQEEVEWLTVAEASRPFDLSRGPLLRAALLSLDLDRHVILLNMHHIVSDGWSTGVLMREVAELYHAYVDGRPAPLDELPIQYADFALWQRHRLSGEVLEQQLDYWRQRLDGVAVLELPTDRPRRPKRTFRGGRRGIALPGRLTASLGALDRRPGGGLFTCLLAGFQTLLHRYTAQNDIAVGSLVANRRRQELEGLIGFFVNTLVLRGDLAGDPTFRSFVEELSDASLEAQAHQDLPFERLVEELQPERDLSHTPLFQVMLSYDVTDPRSAGLKLPELFLSPLAFDGGTAKFDLILHAENVGEGCRLAFEYSSDLFDPTTIERMLRHLEILLEEVARDASQRLSELRLLGGAERHQLVLEWASLQRGERVPSRSRGEIEDGIHRLFERQAAASPDALAVCCEDRALSYAELDRRAELLAHRLHALGVESEVRVGLFLQRNLEMVVAILGVLKAGGAYVPLDPESPPERIAFVLEDTRAPVVLTEEDLVGRLPETAATTTEVLPLAESEVRRKREVEPSSPRRFEGTRAAYVIYTSGSTGRPKGVVVQHGHVARLFRSTGASFDFGDRDVWTLFHSYAFDFSVWEIWGALLLGGRLVAVPFWVSRSPAKFHELLVQERVTVLNQTPSAFVQLVEADAAAASSLASLRWVIFGGEALEPESLRPWFERHGDGIPRLVNMYGITETTVHVTYRALSRRDLEGERGSRIGRAISDLTLLVLDRCLRPPPIGVPGEFHVGGAGVARGYLDRPGLTAARFVPDPFSGRRGERLYRTGDLGRIRADGDAEHLGRIDHQVKVRGFRIELGEIEAALDRHPAVRASVVMAQRDLPSSEPRLVAYWVAGPSAPTIEELHAFLRQGLPEYMVPATFVLLDELPLTANGKVDRKALPAPEIRRSELAADYVAPSTAEEEILSGIWAQVLGVERVGVEDNFFVLGGDSIRSVQVAALAKDRGLELSLQDLFEHQTIVEAASAIRQRESSDGVETAPFSLISEADRARLPEGIEDAYPLTELQAGMLYHMFLEAHDHRLSEPSPERSERVEQGTEYPLYHNVDSMHLRTRFELGPFQQAVQAVVARHPVLRTSFDFQHYSEPLQLVHREVQYPIRCEDLRRLDAADQESLIAAYVADQARRPFELSIPPMLRFTIHRRSDDSFQFTLTENHAILDGWSLHSTLTEIFVHYRSLLNGELRSFAPPLELTFRDFVAAERRALESEEHRRFWLAKLADPTILELPRRTLPPSQRPLRQQEVRARLEGDDLNAIERLARITAVPLKTVLLAVHLKVLSRLSGEVDVLSGLASHGRQERLGSEQVRGLFLNTLPFRLRLPRGSWLGLVRATFEAERDLLPYRRFPLAAIQRLMGKQQLFETMFNYVHFHVVEGVTRAGEIAHLGFETIEQTHFTLAFHGHRTFDGSSLYFLLEYNSEVVSCAQARSILGLYLHACRAMVADPEARHDLDPLLSRGERHQLLVEWNPQAVFSSTACLHELFAAQASRCPEGVAVACEDVWLSYGELDRWSNRLANRLRAQGVGPEVVVGLGTERSPEMVAGILAVLKAGGAYLPLDPSYPLERLRYMLRDARVPVLLTSLPEQSGLGGAELQSLNLDDALGESERAPSPAVRPDNPAYVIYTSGSTGQPKGVPVCHRQVARLLSATEAWFRFSADDVWSQFHSSAFDFSVWELWGALLYRGRSLIVPRKDSRSPEAFRRLLERERVTVLNQIPSFFRQLPTTAPDSLALRQVIFGGEALDVRSLKPWLEDRGERLPHLVNMYGITETTVHVTYRRIDRCDLGDPTNSPIGFPIPDLQLYVVDFALTLVPIGTPGEALIGGAGLGRGYLGRPSLTAERFVPDPWSGRPGASLYRSGDRVRRLPGGELEYLGRIDHQVKVRGFRIELGEIETQLAELPAVEAAVVVTHPDTAGEPRLVAYVVARESSFSAREARELLRQVLPDYMVPSAFVEIGSLPRTASGKIDRRALPAPELSRPDVESAYVAPRSELEQSIAEVWREILGLDKVGVQDNFFDLGGHSLLMMRLRARLREVTSRDLSIVDLFRYPSVGALAGHLGQREETTSSALGSRGSVPRRKRDTADEIAIIGYAGRFPKARDLEEFWQNLRQGVEAVSFYSVDELVAAGVPRAHVEDPHYVRADARLEDVDLFDAALFGISPREAELMDPQHRIFLESAWEALENAAYDPRAYRGAIGVFGGVGTNTYRLNLLSNPALLAAVGDLQGTLGNDKDFLPTRLSYKLNLRGPSINVQTACSTSLVATHLACRSLLDGECDLALAGGVSAESFSKVGYRYVDGGIVSPDGHCRPFDARAQGSVGGNGVGIVVLKRLSEALVDGDTIHAVIKGSAINNDGSLKVGFTAPSVIGQAQVIAAALDAAGLAPDEVSYVETHGTATALGDPIEVAALKRVFGNEPGRRCALGAVKSNIGHTDAAAGVAGLIKAVLALEHGEIPPTLHFESPNPEIDFAESPFYVNASLEPWPSGQKPRRAGVSSFGLGGTNAHVVLEEAPPPEPSGASRPWQLLVLSAATDSALEVVTDRLIGYLDSSGNAATRGPSLLADVAFTYQVGRRRLSHRRMLLTQDLRDAARALRERDVSRLLTAVEEREGRPVTFLFPGLGDQTINMGRRLYEKESSFRAEIDRCSELLERRLGFDLRTVLFPEEEHVEETEAGDSRMDLRAWAGRRPMVESAADRRLARTSVAQPAVFAFEIALARLWMEWGIEPEAMIGYSLGEYTAACLAGVLDLEDALELVAARARWIEDLEPGVMLAVSLEAEELMALAGDGLALAAVNAPQVSVVSGPESAAVELEERLAGRGIAHQRLRTRHAFHSPMMKPIADAMGELLRRIELKAPRIPYVSNLTGTWIRPEEATDPQYWIRHLCETVRFAEGLETLLSQPGRVLLEVGPGRALATSVRQHPGCRGDHLVVSSLGDARDRETDIELMLGALGRLWLGGVDVDWEGFRRHERRRRLPLPTYPFERQRYWIDFNAAALGAGAHAGAEARRKVTKRPDIAEWFYRPTWKPEDLGASARRERGCGPYLLFADGTGVGNSLAKRLVERGDEVVIVNAGRSFAKLPNGGFDIDPRRGEDYQELFRELDLEERLPAGIVHLWGLGPDGEVPGSDGASPGLRTGALLEEGFYSLLHIAQALGSQEVSHPVHLMVVVQGVQQVVGNEVLVPEKAAVLGPCRVFPQEYDNLRCLAVDVVLPEAADELGELVEQLVEELDGESWELAVAYRSGQRWVQDFESVRLERRRRTTPRLRRGGCYLITGGLGGLGRTLARDLAERCQAQLVLVGRTALPPRSEWPDLQAAESPDGLGERIRDVLEIESLSGKALPVSADVADREQMSTVIAEARERFGAIHGVIHTAGVPSQGLAQLKTREAAENVFRAKVRGTRVLESLLAETELDFFVLFSSVTSIEGGLGQVDYCAANAFLDAFAHARTAAGDAFTVAMNWGLWSEVGMGVRTVLLDPEEHRQSLRQGILSEEGVDAFHRVLARPMPMAQVVISPLDFHHSIAQSRELKISEVLRGLEESRRHRPSHARPELLTPYVAPNDDVEQAIAEIWQDLLGIEEVGVHDNFFELGGDSLLGTQLISRLRQALRTELPAAAFFSAPTVAELAAVVGEGQRQQVELEEIEQMLAEVETLSSDEIEAELVAEAQESAKERA